MSRSPAHREELTSDLPEMSQEPGPLAIVSALFSRLNVEGIPYCHWKSNEHLGAALAGATDLDVLVGPEPAALGRILTDIGFKRVVAVPDRAYPGIEDFLALDPRSGKLAHLHLHRQLVLGERKLKGYRLPWEDRMLSTRRLDEKHAVYLADPHLELLLLMIRASLKLRARDLIRSALRKPYFRGGMFREFRWLVERVDQGQLVDTARPLVGERAAHALAALMFGIPSARQLHAFRRAVEPSLSRYRLHGPAEARRERWGREWRTRWRAAAQRGLGVPIPWQRTIPRGGLIVAFLGCDGSGKSTQTREIAGWLSWKLDVLPLYFGSGDGPASLLRQPLRLLNAVRQAPRTQRKRESGSPARRQPRQERTGPRQALRELRQVWWALALAHEKRRRIARADRARQRGMIVICDRYPQSQIVGSNDSPRLSRWLGHRSAMLRALATWEEQAYRAAIVSPPDLVVKLHVTPEVAALRKPDMPRDALPRRVEVIKKLTFPPPTRVVDIDAGQPMSQVLQQIKQAIWQHV